MPEITRGGVHLSYDADGTGPPVVFSHSWFCDARQWPQVRAVARAGYRVLNLDDRGHGRSGPHHAPYTVWDMSDALEAPERFEVALLDFLRDLDGPSR